MIHERLARPELQPLCDELVRRWEASEQPVRSVTLRNLDDPARRALADLLGSERLPPQTMRLPLERLCLALRTDVAGLRSALVDLRGPLANRAGLRRERVRARSELWGWLDREAVRLGVLEWSQRLQAKGVPHADVERHRRRLESAIVVLDRLPADDVPLAGLACDLTGDPHALDHGTWLSNTVLDAISQRQYASPPTTAEETRRLWASVGVLPDGLSSSVLVLGITTTGDSPLARMLRGCADESEPVAMTESQLRRWPVRARFDAAYAFENPSILAQASLSSWRSPPLICTAGWPNVAAITLLRQLVTSGVTVQYHGDFDPKGIEIAQMLRARLGIEPWKMTRADYEPHAARAREETITDVPDADWDPGLSLAMRARRRPVFEEEIRHELLGALRRGEES